MKKIDCIPFVISVMVFVLLLFNTSFIKAKDMEYADKIFKPFHQLNRDEYIGTGVGLATVERVVQRHGGKVWVDSQLDKGATIYFTLAADPKVKEKLRQEI